LPAIVSGWLLAFTLSWDDLVITQFVAGPGSSTLPMVIFSKVRFGVTPDVNALATIMVLLVATGVAISTVWMRYRERRRARDLQLAAAANLCAEPVPDGASLASQALGRPVLFLNDADAAGLAEMRWGAGRGCRGTVVMLTFGTGIGTALFAGGKLFPNTELGHLELRGMDAEKWTSARVRTAENLDFPAWIERVNEYLAEMHRLFWPDVFILGGAVSER